MLTKYIPSIFTLSNLTCGLLAIYGSDPRSGSWLLLLSMFFDALDGASARAFNAQSDLGKELDSLCDLVSFGLAPAYLYRLLAPSESPWYLIPIVIMTLCSALRLAKFNLLAPSKYFTGMPTPATALFIVGILIAHEYKDNIITHLLDQPFIYALLPILLGVLMLSPLRMFSLKGINKGLGENKVQVLLIVFFIGFSMVDFKLAIPLTIILYVALSILHTISHKENI